MLDAIPLLGSGKINYVALAKALRESGGARVTPVFESTRTDNPSI